MFRFNNENIVLILVGEVSGPGGFPAAIRGPRPLLGMQYQGRPRGNFRGRPMAPRGGPMHPRFQRPPRGHPQGNEVNVVVVDFKLFHFEAVSSIKYPLYVVPSSTAS